MKIAILANSISHKGAGISYFVNGLALHLKRKLKVGLFSLEDDNQASNKNDDISVLFQKSVFNGFSIGYSLEMKKYLTRHITEYSLIYTKSIWGLKPFLGFFFLKKIKN